MRENQVKTLNNIAEERPSPTCVAVGVFDGVHIGHQAVLRQAVAGAREQGLVSAALTFDPHPARVVQPRRAPLLLTTLSERAALIAELGIEAVVVAKFDRAFADLTPEEFARCVLVEQLRARCVVAGEGFIFGRGASGNVAVLAELGGKLGFRASAVKRVTADGGEVSSTAVRDLVSAGDLEGAARLLGHHYIIAGPVEPGARRGRELGFPTANICVAPEKLLPPDGVYAARARLEADPLCAQPGDHGGGAVGGEDARGARENGRAISAVTAGEAMPAVMNIGVRPTFAGARRRRAPGDRCVEAHIMGAEPGDLYGRRLRLDVVGRLREEERFPSPRALAEQIRRDIARAQEMLKDREQRH